MEKRVLIARWLGSDTQPIPIYDEASISSARQRVREAGERFNLHKDLVETVALIASELTHNQLSHAKQGYFAVKPIERDGVRGLEVIAADLGPGIEKPATAIRGEVSRITGSLGAGLGAVKRLSDETEFDNRLLEGACILARKFESSSVTPAAEAAIMSKPFPGEVISGDDSILIHSLTGFMCAVADGLGHGPEAREASNRAMELIGKNHQMALDQLADVINAGLAGTRGCALSVARYIKDARTLEYAAAGDVHAHLYHLREAHFFTPVSLVLGTGQLKKQKIRIETQTVKSGSVLVMFTDGLKSRTNLKGQLDVLRQPAIAITQHLLEHDSRPDDDALVFVAKFR
jgi:anti-sigma regulatory factor (Ser/Thr protein kinase)